jgi:hypothetical protein
MPSSSTPPGVQVKIEARLRSHARSELSLSASAPIWPYIFHINAKQVEAYLSRITEWRLTNTESCRGQMAGYIQSQSTLDDILTALAKYRERTNDSPHLRTRLRRGWEAPECARLRHARFVRKNRFCQTYARLWGLCAGRVLLGDGLLLRQSRADAVRRGAHDPLPLSFCLCGAAAADARATLHAPGVGLCC